MAKSPEQLAHEQWLGYLVHDSIEARLLQPNVAYCEAGRVDGTDRRPPVIEVVVVAAGPGDDSTDPVLADGAERNAIDEPR
jgi:hypothetical protein